MLNVIYWGSIPHMTTTFKIIHDGFEKWAILTFVVQLRTNPKKIHLKLDIQLYFLYGINLLPNIKL